MIYFNSCFKIMQNWRMTISALVGKALRSFLPCRPQDTSFTKVTRYFRGGSGAEHVIGPM